MPGIHRSSLPQQMPTQDRLMASLRGRSGACRRLRVDAEAGEDPRAQPQVLLPPSSRQSRRPRHDARVLHELGRHELLPREIDLQTTGQAVPPVAAPAASRPAAAPRP